MSLGQEIPLHPWTKLAKDLFHVEGASNLLIVDYKSRFPVVCKLSSMTGQHVANYSKQVFSEYVWPETLISDNGLCGCFYQCNECIPCQSHHKLTPLPTIK